MLTIDDLPYNQLTVWGILNAVHHVRVDTCLTAALCQMIDVSPLVPALLNTPSLSHLYFPGEYIASANDITTEGGGIQQAYLLQNPNKSEQALAVQSEQWPYRVMSCLE